MTWTFIFFFILKRRKRGKLETKPNSHYFSFFRPMLSVYLKLCEKNRYLPNFILNEKKIFMIKTAFPLREEKKTYSSTKELKINIGFLCTVFCSVRWDSFLCTHHKPLYDETMQFIYYVLYVCNGVRCIKSCYFQNFPRHINLEAYLTFLLGLLRFAVALCFNYNFISF